MILSKPSWWARPSSAPAAIVLVGAAMLVLAGCSGSSAPSSSQPQVASLPSTGSSTRQGPDPADPTTTDATKTDATNTGQGRPQERLDDTPEERAALIHAWDVCLVHHGAKYADESGVRAAAAEAAGAQGDGPVYRSVAEPIPAAARKACTSKLPLGPPELDPGLNPHYRDDMVAEIKCLRAHGIKVHLVADTSDDPDGLTWTYDDNAGDLPDNEGQIEDACELAAFGGKH